MNAKENLSESVVSPVQILEEVKISDTGDSVGHMFLMELLLADMELLIHREFGRDTVTLIAKLWDVFEDFAIRESTEIGCAAAVIQLLKGQIGFGAFGSIAIDVDSPNWIAASWLIVPKPQYLAG